jgi:hypothetical protein
LPRTTLTITGPQRAAIYRQVIQNLSGIGDVYGEYVAGNIAVAESLADDFVDDLRLLEDIGWSPEDPRESFELTVAADELVSMLRRLCEEVKDGLDDPDQGRAEEEAAKVRADYERTGEVCAELIGALRDRQRSELMAAMITAGATQREALRDLMGYRLFVIGSAKTCS